MDKAMLWLPGWGMSDECWNPIRSRFPLYRHATPDYSRVTHPDHFFEAVREAVCSLGSIPVYVIGWSMGGMLAQRLASVHPIAGLVLISTTARFVRSREERGKGWAEAQLQRMQNALFKDQVQVMERFSREIVTEAEWGQVQLQAFQKIVDGGWSLEALVAGLTFLQEEDCRIILGSLACAPLVIHGMSDTICPFSAGEELGSLIPQASFLPIAECGHAPMIFQPHKVAAAIKRMVEDDVENGCRATIS